MKTFSEIHTFTRTVPGFQPLLPHFRSAVENALQRYGPNRVDRSIAAWQRMIRLLVGTELLLISRTLPPSLFPEYWNVAAQSFELEVKNWEIIQGATSQNPSSIWGLKYHGNEASNGWLDVYFHSSSGDDFRGYLPKTEPIYDAVRCRQKPETFFDDYKWADFGLPQLFNTAVTLADRFSDETFPESVVWNLEDYETSSLA